MHNASCSFAKRSLDIVLALLGLVVLSPLFILVSVAIKLTSQGPVIFCQTRVGLDHNPFTFYKFRTMVKGAQEMGLGYAVARDDDRFTWVGKYLRHTSMDELPQLLNVIKGDMSLVGPRPTIAAEVEKWNPRYRERHRVRPGISGWAQINGRNLLNWDEKLLLDMWYVDNWSFLLDLRILMRTLPVVLGQKGLYDTSGFVRGKDPSVTTLGNDYD